MTLLEIEHMTKTYNLASKEPVYALKNINMTLNPGELVAIIGTSGSGKSTLLRMLGCIDSPSSGTYTLNGKDMATMNDQSLANYRNQEIGFIMQDFALIDYYSVKKNILLPLMYEKKKELKKQRKKELLPLLEKLSIAEKINSKVTDLSGGQKQRVAIARALINDPEILLADEPTGALDEQTTAEIMAIFKQLHKEGKTIIIVTHDMQVANQCNRILRMQDGHLAEAE